jgi:hypothetical protein
VAHSRNKIELTPIQDTIESAIGSSHFLVVAECIQRREPRIAVPTAVVITDTGHLDFAYLANAQVGAPAKQLIAQYYQKPAAHTYFAGCSTGGREGMILSQRYPTAFDGIISGDPAMRTGLSNLAIGKWIPVAFNQIAPGQATRRRGQLRMSLIRPQGIDCHIQLL